MLLISETFFYSGSLCQEEGSEESRVLISDGEDCSECSSESGCDWESESDIDPVYVPTPDRARLGKVSPVDLPNRLCFMTLPDLGKFLKLLNEIRHCATPGCKGNVVPVDVKCQGLGGAVCVSCCCDGCSLKGAVFTTHVSHDNRNVISTCIQVGFICAGITHAVYYKTLKNALGIEAVSAPAFMDTIYSMYPIVKAMLDDICETAKQEMKDKREDELGSWQRAVTVADGTWQTRGWHSKNATFTIRNYLNGGLLYYHHLCQKGRDEVIEEELYKGTSKSSEGYAASITFQRAKDEGMQIAVHWQDADSSSANAVREVFPDADIMICGGHAGRAHKKMLKSHQKKKRASEKMIEKYGKAFPALCELSCKCTGNHSAACGCLTDAFISKAHTNFTSILMEVKSQEEFVRRLTALPKHARDVHEWKGGRCDYHPLWVCTCNKCPTEEIKCEGKPYQTRLKLDCEFHALLYEIECMGRASQASRLVHPVLKRGHSNLVEASHNVLIRFRSKDISLERLHYHLSTNLGLLQANLSYMHAKRGTSYHWIPELYRRMKLPVFHGIVEALEKHSARRKRKLEWAKGTPQKKRRIELKKKRVIDGQERKKWSKKHGHDYGCDSENSDIDVKVSRDKGRRKGRPQGKGECASCGSSTHKRSNHRDCPFNKKRAEKETISSSRTESDGEVSSESSSEMESGTDVCTCGSEGKRHRRSCPLSYRNRQPGRTLFPATSNAGQLASPSALKVECSPGDSVFPPSSKKEKTEMKVGDHVCIHWRNMGSSHLPCRIVGVFSGRYQLYCSQGVLITSFCATELTPLASGSSISLENWRQAPKVSLRSVADDPALLECCNCDIPLCSGSIVISSASEEENEAPNLWVNNGAYSLSHRDRGVILSERGWLTDNIICAAQMLLLQFFPNMAGLQPPVLQKVCAFQVHSGEFVQIVHVGNNHWCVVSTVGCESGAVYVYDSLYKSPTKELIHLIASMMHSQSNELKITMMDVEKQSNGSDCGVLAIAYAFDLCSGFDPCSARFDHSGIRLHLTTCLENCHVSRFPVLGERKSAPRKPRTLELHCSCRMPEEKGDEMAECDVCHVWYHRHCMDIPSEVFGEVVKDA